MARLHRNQSFIDILTLVVILAFLITSLPPSPVVTAADTSPPADNPEPPPPPGLPTIDPSMEQASLVTTPATDSTLVSADGKVSITIPAGAVREDVQIVYAPSQPWPSSGMKMIKYFDLKGYAVNRGNAEVSQFAKDLTITLKNDDAELRGGDIDSLKLFYFDDATRTWRPVSSQFDPHSEVPVQQPNAGLRFRGMVWQGQWQSIADKVAQLRRGPDRRTRHRRRPVR